MSKYNSLAIYLFGQPQDISELGMGFTEIEGIIKCKLPPTARIDRPWWANTEGSNHAKQWLSVGWKVKNVDMQNQTVTFARTRSELKLTDLIAATKVSGGYDNLSAFFRNVPFLQVQLALSFSSIGDLMGQSLPNTAFNDRTWWANTATSPQGRSWLSAGWLVESVYLPAEIVVFRRKGENQLDLIARYVRNLLERKRLVGRPNVNTIVKWIRLCRIVGWFYEGTILYENGGLEIDSLNEMQQLEVEDDYMICKREITRYSSKNEIC